MKFKDKVALVYFTASWAASEFRANTSRTGELSHTWEFAVTHGKDVRFVRMYGDLAPGEIS